MGSREARGGGVRCVGRSLALLLCKRMLNRGEVDASDGCERDRHHHPSDSPNLFTVYTDRATGHQQPHTMEARAGRWGYRADHGSTRLEGRGRLTDP